VGGIYEPPPVRRNDAHQENPAVSDGVRGSPRGSRKPRLAHPSDAATLMRMAKSPPMNPSATVIDRARVRPTEVVAPQHARAVAAWLLVCCALVFAMVVVGGVTRLTHSGLSITEWQPIVGTLPPLNDVQWQQAFAKYQQTPEYRLVNHDMTIEGFKRIFWWEYFHRLLGRAIGVVFLLPFVYFVARRRIARRYVKPLVAIFVLGALQGAMGWYMVQSGLVDDPRVSQFRLTAHLGLAFLIFGAMLWTAMSMLAPDRQPVVTPAQRSTRALAFALAALVLVMVLTGGLVAGIRAGFAYNTFPLMNGAIVPPEIFMIDPWWRNFFWNMATVQFDHRLIAWALAFAVPIVWWKIRATVASARARTGANVLLALLAAQLALGIATLINVVPLPLAAAHQAGAVLVFAAALNVAHALR
jgi:cytochrome c oxidase assembly protein subunit 15